jgi:DNA-binding winged helix-turn-helix (wHTH) protein
MTMVRDFTPVASAIEFGPFCLRPMQRQLECGGSTVKIGSRALELLTALVERAGEIVPQSDLIARIWPDTAVEESGVRVQLASLRKVLRDGEGGIRYIATVPGRGYCFVAPLRPVEKAEPTARWYDPKETLSVAVKTLADCFTTTTPQHLTLHDAETIDSICRRLDGLAEALREVARDRRVGRVA